MARLNIIPRILLLCSLLLPITGAFSADDGDVAWIADQNGCKVANPFPQPGESISWSGSCESGLADGEGVLQWSVNESPGDRFEGTLKKGWAEGKGTLTRGEGGRYTGDWVHSMQEGDGRYDAPDGSWYQGQWHDGQPHGHGQFRSRDGRLFIGEWVNGVYQGDLEDDPNRT